MPIMKIEFTNRSPRKNWFKLIYESLLLAFGVSIPPDPHPLPPENLDMIDKHGNVLWHDAKDTGE